MSGKVVFGNRNKTERHQNEKQDLRSRTGEKK